MYAVLRGVIVGLCFSIGCVQQAAALPLGSNLIVNPGAEAGAGDPVGNQVIRPIPGWTPQSIFSVLRYDATGFEFVNNFGNTVFAGNFPNASSPGPQDRGDNMFFGGGERSASSASQSIDMLSFAALIDQGWAGFDLSGWLGGYQDNADSAELQAHFLDAQGAVLGIASLIAPTPAERNNITGLYLRETGGLLPVGTRSVDIVLNMNYARGRTNDGYADNLLFAVRAIPEPASIASLFAAGAAAIAVRRARQ
jgi:hypothetical protein